MSARTEPVTSLPSTDRAVAIEHQAQTALRTTTTALLICLALLFLARRLSGAFVQPLHGLGLIGVALAAAAGAVGVRRWMPETDLARGRQIAYFRFAIPGLVAALVLLSVTLPGTPVAWITVAWVVLIASEMATWIRALRPRRAAEFHLAAEESELPSGLIQQLTRVLEQNRESIHALVRADVPVGDRQAIVHLAFCPPLEARPELTGHALENDDADVRVTQAERFGARIEVRLSHPSDEQKRLLVEILGSATANSTA